MELAGVNDVERVRKYLQGIRPPAVWEVLRYDDLEKFSSNADENLQNYLNGITDSKS